MGTIILEILKTTYFKGVAYWKTRLKIIGFMGHFKKEICQNWSSTVIKEILLNWKKSLKECIKEKVVGLIIKYLSKNHKHS